MASSYSGQSVVACQSALSAESYRDSLPDCELLSEALAYVAGFNEDEIDRRHNRSHPWWF